MPNAAPAPAPSIRPVPPEVSLLTSANPLPAEVASFDRWRTGLTQREIHGIKSGTWPVDCVTDETKEPIDEGLSTPTEFVPVAIYSHHGCVGRVDEAEYLAEARDALEVQTAFYLENELWTGATTGNPSLQSTALDISALIGTVPVGVGISVLLQAFSAASRGAMGTIHVPLPTLHELTLNNIVVRNGNRLETILGNIVIPGPGYPVAPASTAPEGSEEPSFGSFYIYISGPVEVGLGPVTITGSNITPGGSYSRQNLVEFYAERPAIVRFPTDPVFAISVSAVTLEGG